MTYAERKNTMSKLEYAKLNSKWANRPQADQPNQITEQRRNLWNALNAFITERGGAIVTPMFVSPVRIEVAPDSELPAKLTEAGYDLVFRTEETRIGGPASPEYEARWRRGAQSAGYGFFQVNVFELRLPK